ncbi:hypothetical protein Z517_09590 [Fonsecaea pedrosoi CBS 271.37]|uniref:Unplaced genomic scaffold supercont1.6, whole genome shotgun sequence n=1 Tax=Fonsecaea pedrosoi CBS 271.37 TaxID=1442368 RepID=A0A0D2GXP7_9EURO|nr:uncharacterized protein Z517_09590 [Fonsecaea pedrosoi CBS 271.37]KIW77144.1 hypothetical protein Z517_09590 [Fonsecaea pedrosoi CBS 271.37]
MVSVVLAGGSGGLGREVLLAIRATGKHHVKVFSRKPCPDIADLGVEVVQVDYADPEHLASSLNGVHTVLSFVLDNETCNVQRPLVDACVKAGVRRFAPSEWAWAPDGNPVFRYKENMRKYLEEINTPVQKLEYTLFQPGWFMNYLTYPRSSCRYFHQTCVWIDLNACQALAVRDADPWIALTTVQDTARVAALALDDPVAWPVAGHIVESRIKLRNLIKLAERMRGRSFDVHEVDIADIENGKLKSSWLPPTTHPTAGSSSDFAEAMACLWLSSAIHGAMDGSPIWNERLPNLQLTDAESFLSEWYKDV